MTTTSCILSQSSSLNSSVTSLASRRLASRGPRYTALQTRQTAKVFLAAVRHQLQRVADGTETTSPTPDTGIARDIETHAAAFAADYQAFEEADSMLGASLRGSCLYTAKARRLAMEVAQSVAQVRAVLGDVLDARFPEEAVVLEACAVGERINYESPMEVLRFSQRQVAALSNADTYAFLVEYGAHPHILLQRLKDGVALLDSELNIGAGLDAQELRQLRDAAQVRLEVSAERILGLTNLAFGQAARDALRARLPKVRSSRSAAKAQGGTVDPPVVLSGTNPNTPDVGTVGLQPFLTLKNTTGTVNGEPTPTNGSSTNPS